MLDRIADRNMLPPGESAADAPSYHISPASMITLIVVAAGVVALSAAASYFATLTLPYALANNLVSYWSGYIGGASLLGIAWLMNVGWPHK